MSNWFKDRDDRLLGPHLDALKAAAEVGEKSVAYVQEHHSDGDLANAWSWVSVLMSDSVSSTFESLRAIYFVPTNEAEHEFNQALVRAIASDYRAVRSHLRTALELCAVAAAFTAGVEADNKRLADKALSWTSADGMTPRFSEALDWLRQHSSVAAALDRERGWISRLKSSVYGRLCNYAHVGGIAYQQRNVEPGSMGNGVRFPHFSDERLELALQDYVSVVRWSATLLAMGNPLCVVGLPLWEKFAFNAPASGFMDFGQARAFQNILVPDLRDRLVLLAEEDESVRSARAWVEGLPDLTSDEIDASGRSIEELLAEMNDDGEDV